MGEIKEIAECLMENIVSVIEKARRQRRPPVRRVTCPHALLRAPSTLLIALAAMLSGGDCLLRPAGAERGVVARLGRAGRAPVVVGDLRRHARGGGGRPSKR